MRRFITLVLVGSLLHLNMQASVHAAVISAGDYLPAAEPAVTLECLDALLAREDVRQRLVDLGVDPEQALTRAAAMTDAELAVLAQRLDAMPAGKRTRQLWAFLQRIFRWRARRAGSRPSPVA